MSEKTHWKKLQNPDYLGAYALDEGQEPILTIRNVQVEKVTSPEGRKEECVVCHFMESGVKPMILNATNCKTITKLYKTPYIEEWKGRKIQIFVDKVRAFGDVVDALRIRPFVPRVQVKATKAVCSDCGKEITPFNGKSAEWLAQYTQNNYGKPLCSDCAKKAAEDKTNIENEARELTNMLEGE